jgi:hypothetical protein
MLFPIGTAPILPGGAAGTQESDHIGGIEHACSRAEVPFSSAVNAQQRVL